MIYLATAYTSSNFEIMEENYITACKAIAYFVSKGLNIISPIVAYHQPAIIAGNQNSSIWYFRSEALLRLCDIFYFLRDSRGRWENSKGMKNELELGIDMNKYIYIVDELKYVTTYCSQIGAVDFLMGNYA